MNLNRALEMTLVQIRHLAGQETADTTLRLAAMDACAEELQKGRELIAQHAEAALQALWETVSPPEPAPPAEAAEPVETTTEA